MGMATNVDDDEQIKREFCSLNTFFKEIKQSYFLIQNTSKKFPWVCHTIIRWRWKPEVH